MIANNSQADHSPSELSIPTNEHQSNIDRFLSTDIVITTPTTDQSSSSIQLNPTDMIANIQQHNHVSTITNSRPGEQYHHQQKASQQIQQQQNRQEQQRRLQQQQQCLQPEQRRIQQEQRRLQQEQQRLRQETQRERQRRQRERQQQRFKQWLESQNLTHKQWLERQNQRYAQSLASHYNREQERWREEHEEWQHEQYLRQRSPGFDEGSDEIFQERQLEQHHLERMTPQERQEIWEQEYLNELQHGMPMHNFERYTTDKDEQLWTDELEQTMNIDQMQKWDELQQHNRNEEQLIQKEQWEAIAFLHQQLQ